MTNCDFCEEPIPLSTDHSSCEGCGCQVHDYCERDAGWVRDPEYIPLCPACKDPTPAAPVTATPPLPASLDDADLVPWLVILDYGDMGPLDSSAWAKILGPAYAAKAAAVRALVRTKVTDGVVESFAAIADGSNRRIPEIVSVVMGAK